MGTRHRDCTITLHKRRCVDRTAQLPDGRQFGSNVLVSDWPVIYQTEDFVPNSSTRRDKAGAIYFAGSCRMARIALPPAELAVAIVLQ
jgi:hypothetical protein